MPVQIWPLERDPALLQLMGAFPQLEEDGASPQ